jgi:arsenate reductase-like glutaredoxin family protein
LKPIAQELIKKSEKIGNAHIVTIFVSKETKRNKVKKNKKDAFNCLGEPISELINESNEKLNQHYVLLSVFMCAELDPIPAAPVLLRRPVVEDGTGVGREPEPNCCC